METIKKFTDSENIEYKVINDGKFKFVAKDLDSNNVITVVICPSLEMAISKYNDAIKSAA